MKKKILIFFLVGIILYILDISINSNEGNEIYISDQEVLSLVSAWKSQVGRDPTDDEVYRIINSLIEEEILYREALKLGLDSEDKIIKRRLAQKITFLKQETFADKLSEEELNNFFNANRENYYIGATYSFSHYFFSFENDSNKRANDAYLKVNSSENINSDPFFLGKNFANENLKNIGRNFGKNFTNLIQETKLNQWSSPIESAYGHHLIYISDYKEGYYPIIDEVLNQVKVDLLQSKRDTAIKDYLDEVKSEYVVIINPDLKF